MTISNGRLEIRVSKAATNGCPASAIEFRDKKAPSESLRFNGGVNGDPIATSNSVSWLKLCSSRRLGVARDGRYYTNNVGSLASNGQQGNMPGFQLVSNPLPKYYFQSTAALIRYDNPTDLLFVASSERYQ